MRSGAWLTICLCCTLSATQADITWTQPADGGLQLVLSAGGDELVVGPELFGLTWADGTRLTALNFDLNPPVTEPNSLRAVFTGLASRIEYRLEAVPGHPWWRVTLLVDTPQPVTACDVVRLQSAPEPDLGDFGQPWFLAGTWFAGVESPASDQTRDGEVVVLRHHPGQAAFTSKTAIIGHRGDEPNVEDAFAAYVVETGTPRRSFLQYNSWYDLRGAEMTVENFAGIFKGFQDSLLQPYGLRFDAFVPDDGWQNKQSIWEVDRKILPHEFKPLAEILEAGGSRLGIWMPINGTNLDTSWGKAQGYLVSELSDRHYQLTDPKYDQAIRAALKHRIEDGNLAYFKHDFNNFRTRRNHPLGPQVDFEQNLDAQLAIHRYERSLQPGIFLNITSGMWLSPWWLQEADSIWMAASDFGFENRFPQPSRRDWAMSYRDQHFYRKYVVERQQYPLSRLMTHGIIYGQRNQLGGTDETLREWSDYVVMYYARGVQLKELYVTPKLMTEERWRVLGRADQWAEAHAATLDHTRFVGGRPDRGEVYGYVHWGPDEGLVVVRNPAPADGTLALTLAERPRRMGPPGTWRVNMLYPTPSSLPGSLSGDGQVALPAPGQSVCLYRLTPTTSLPAAGPAKPALSGSAELQATTELRLSGEVNVADGVLLPELQLQLKAAAPPKLAELQVSGLEQPAVRVLTGTDNQVIRIALTPGRHTFTARLTAPAALFQTAAGSLSVWLRAEQDVALPPDREAEPVPQRPLELRCLLPETPYAFTAGPVNISDEELAHPNAVRLRFEIFDSNGEPPYDQKRVLLNGREVAPVPANPRARFSDWKEVTIDLKPDAAGTIARENTLAVTTSGGDCWKCRGLALAVQKQDGTWVPTRVDPRIFSAGGESWKYFEGESWTAGASPAIKLRLPAPGE